MSDPATKLLDDRIQKAVDQALERTTRSAETGSGGTGGGDMERRIAAIEQSLESLRTDTSGLMESSGKIQLDAAEIKGKLSQMPTGFQFIGWMAAFGISLIALVFAALKFSQP